LVVNRGRSRLGAAKLRDLELAGQDLAESHEPSKHAAHADLYVAIRDAFNSAGRKIQDYARKRRGAVKVHEPAALARVSRIFTNDSYGFLETPDGREIYFHRNSVLQAGFDQLEPGAEVHFAEGAGEKGPQATTVRLIGKS
jgi:cold shock CspA family protein